MRPSSAKAKGRRLQQRVAADIVQTCGLEPDDVTSRSSGATGTDVLLSPAARRAFPYAVECKNVESLNVWKSFEQAAANGQKEKLVPVLVAARNHTEPLAILRWADFLNLHGVGAVL